MRLKEPKLHVEKSKTTKQWVAVFYDPEKTVRGVIKQDDVIARGYGKSKKEAIAAVFDEYVHIKK